MSDFAIRVSNLSKCYQIYNTPRDRLKQFVAPQLQRLIGQSPKQYFREFWALKDVSFEIKKGETVGIIGRNGSGKSTLLQMICGTLTPTNGSIQTNGRIAALLELGSGFNPEFTGRENVYMNAAVLGLTRKKIDARFDDIVKFSEIKEFIEQPVKTYSSGMVVRLAFAVAINVDPEILIVDEALSVGDELFQRKCFSKIEAIRAKGVTIIFVSHSGATVLELCNRAMLLDDGERLAIGHPKHILGRYQKLLYVPAEKRNFIREQIRNETSSLNGIETEIELQYLLPETDETSDTSSELLESFDPNLKPTSTIRYESLGAQIESPQITKLSGERVNNLISGRVYLYTYVVRFEKAANNVRFGMLIKTTSGFELGGAISSKNLGSSTKVAYEGSCLKVEFAFKCALNSGVYFMNAGVTALQNGSEVYLHRLLDAEMFRVIPSQKTISLGSIDFECAAKLDFLT